MVAEAANEKVKSLSNYDEKSERGKLRAKNSRRESAMLTAGKLPPKLGTFITFVETRLKFYPSKSQFQSVAVWWHRELCLDSESEI